MVSMLMSHFSRLYLLLTYLKAYDAWWTKLYQPRRVWSRSLQGSINPWLQSRHIRIRKTVFQLLHEVISPVIWLICTGRICPGRYFAEADIWLAMANILTVFDIKPAVDDQGADILPDPQAFISGLNRWVNFVNNCSSTVLMYQIAGHCRTNAA